MKDKQLACAVLIIFSVLVGYLAQLSYGRMTSAKNLASEAKKAAMADQQAFSVSKLQLERLKKSTEEIRTYYEAWEPYITTTQSPQATEQRIIDLVKRAGVFTVSQRFELINERNEPMLDHRLRAHVTVEDEYSKALNWLGSLESELPTARIASCRLVRGESGDDLRMELVVDIPVVNLDEA